MNLDDFMFLHQGNGVSSSNNGDYNRIPVTPEGSYMQRQQVYHNWMEPDGVMQRLNPSFEMGRVSQMLPFDIGQLTEESVQELHLYLAKKQRNQIQSPNFQMPVLNPKPSEMQQSCRLLNSLSSPNRISQTRDSIPTQMQGYLAQNNADWTETIGLYTDILCRDVAIGNHQWQVDKRGANNAQGMLTETTGSYYSDPENRWGQQNCVSSNQWQQEHVLAMNRTILETNQSASSTTICFNNAPVTPEKDNRSRLNQLSTTENSYAILNWSPEKDKLNTEPNQLLTGGIVSPYPEGDNTDLNKTPQQKPPKRKKHRPKVIIEGKPKRTPKKPVVSKTEIAAGNESTGKRKYVSRKGLETSTTPPLNNEKSEFEGSKSGSKTTKSCRRELKFNSKQEKKDKNSYLHDDSHEMTLSTGLNSVIVVLPPTAKKDERNVPDGVGKLQTINSWNLISAANQRIANEVPQRDRKVQLSNVRNVKTQNTMSCQENHVSTETERLSSQELAWASSYNTETPGTNYITDFQEKTGQKRDYVNTSGGGTKTSSVSEISNLGAYKRTRLDESRTAPCSLPAEYKQWQVYCREMLDCSKEIEVYENRDIVTENQFHNVVMVVENNSHKSGSLVAEIIHRNGMTKDSLQQKTETRVSATIVGNATITSHSESHTVKEVSTSRKARGKKEEKVVINPIDEIIHRLELLGISDQQGALVPYEGHGTIVPFEKFEPIKRRKPRPRVDLDSESITQWNLLMGKAENEAPETGPDKEKWWEAERKVFRGRVDKFIARMHLVQGDRRFSRWKGSVVDSVIGVFLTQNVSDHLSSSAFMSLAARFPLKSAANTENTSCNTSISAWVEEPEVQVIDPDGTITFPWETIRQPLLYKQDSEAIGVHLIEDNNNYSPKDVVSSQNSSDSIILQANEDIRNSSDSEVEYQTIFPQDPNLTRSHFPRHQQISAGSIDLNVLLSEESFDPVTSINPMNSISHTRVTENKSMSYFNPSEAEATKIQGNLLPTGENIGSAGSKISNERRKKNDVNKMKEVDWDELRKQVVCEGTKKERGRDKMDSMDYEDISQADVSRISDAIRERGMNNMLAERIKAFLNRVVKDHGSIDLEWLRDVPPDKAKDYLLSIRGLGLKSVECIRLLSLENKAFPVDTNVGRIAVRLGWVPLQPLPESLQLHLLEMYPILESIQKYIWPRLCKLDQRTLYELHYQMITFGKVFCTKSRPNCNVCPMKGECRHFASAFASARLALPGPEEKGMVSSSGTPVAPSEDRPPILMEPLLLDFSESSLGSRGLMRFAGECEPIIEEPTTPEMYREETESDIEDLLLLSEDPNEIPVIEFSLEALKANVQKIMQDQNIVISDGDLSKALVAVNPATASIPVPKLKNVSRLRTEHHVYELPDLHPVLEGLDRREPDDPSPYLLAIWTPGETADSIQQYENNCTLRGSGRLCDEKTCFQCNSIREADSQMVRGTILVPCRTAMRGSFPLNGTYFQVNEVFADHESSMNPIAVPRDLIWNLRRRTVYFGTSVTSIFRGMPIEEIQYCFWRGFVCVRGFDREGRAPRPLMARLHFAASRLAKNKKEEETKRKP